MASNNTETRKTPAWLNRSNLMLLLAAILVLAAVLILTRDWGNLFGRPKITTVAFFQVSKTVGLDFSRPVSADNPPDPASPKDTSTYEFAGASGKLLITMYPNNAAVHPLLTFVPVRQPVRPPMWVQRLENISNPARRALTMAAQRGPWAMQMWLRRAGANKAQQQAAHTAWQSYQAALTILQQEQEAGSFAPGHLQAVLHALEKFNQDKGNVFKNTHKQNLAQAVFAAGQSYLRQLRAARNKAREHYIDTVYSSLTDSQRTALSAAITQFLKRFGG